jgi:hypothetical protein
MKRWSYLLASWLVLTSFYSANAVDKTGKLSIGGQAGFSVGFGSAFSDHSINYNYKDDYSIHYTVKNQLRQEWAVKMKYGLKPNWTLAGIYEYQAAKPSVIGTTGIGGYLEGSVLESFGCAAVNIIYIRSPEKNTSTYYTGGLGWYMIKEGKDRPGMNIGVGAESSLSNHLDFEVGLRFHTILTDPRITTYINAFIGLNCPL